MSNRRTLREMFASNHHPIGFTVLYIINELSRHLNATFQCITFTNRKKLDNMSRNTSMIGISWGPFRESRYYVMTEPLVRMDVLWLVPKAKQISNMNVCLYVFKYDVWIATSVVFICGWLTWFLILSRNGGFTFDKLCISFLNVWSLTICGNVVSQLPRSLALRILLLFYLIYVIHIQCAFTSDMSTVLTTPRYDFQIRNLKELADSQLPIYSSADCKTLYFSKNNTDWKLYTKLQKSIHVLTSQDQKEYVNLLDAEIFLGGKVDAYEIRDNSMISVHTIRLRLLIDHYFTTTLNIFISRMIESGIHDKRKNDFYQKYRAEKVETPQEDELTLKHLIFIFVILGFGLCTACMVFCFELVLNKYL
ncbi:hypothetical protein RI129_012631 [Pyrocoelia pectoralis]|uniref:Ionotropic glutamate receptor C-terminal domain-containing protein n=1 Tax=Pyrocoelia pectoralis TaxID=417401 RepID=A0AAN7V377_9COLE